MRKLIFILSCISLYSFAEEDLFNHANNLYVNENYTEAIRIYESILAKELESDAVYYNMGNCYYKNKDWANAIWCYEKSLKLKKNKETIQNLTLVNLKIVDKIEPIPELFYKIWWKNIIQLLNPRNWQILAIFSVWMVLILWILNNYRIIHTQKTNKILLSIALVLLCITHASLSNSTKKQEGIIFSSAVVVYSAPTDNSTDLFLIHAGLKVQIIDEIGEWINIRITNGNSGWIKNNSCKLL